MVKVPIQYTELPHFLGFLSVSKYASCGLIWLFYMLNWLRFGILTPFLDISHVKGVKCVTI